jgi:hypothetical protein
MATRYTLRGEKVMDKWATIVENGAGRDKWVLDTSEEYIKNSNMPGVWCGQSEVSLSGVFSPKRPFLLLYHSGLKAYRMYIGARDFGAHLDVSWFVTFYASPLKNLLGRYASPMGLSMEINTFDQQDLGAIITIAHHCVMRVVTLLNEELNQSPTMNTQSKGFLSVW